MQIKNTKGISGIDIIISVIILTVFITIIGNLIVNTNLNRVSTQRKSKATTYAIQEIEKWKVKTVEQINSFIDTTNSNMQNRDYGDSINEAFMYDENILENGSFTGYNKQVVIEDYVLVKNDYTKQENILKKITVNISYKVGGNNSSVSLSTYIVRE